MESVYLLVPCRNEAGNIPFIVEEYLALRQKTWHLVLVEGKSEDNSESVCRDLARSHRKQNVHFMKQVGLGKFAAVRTAFEELGPQMKDSLIAIWDSDHSIKLRSFCGLFERAQNEGLFIYTERIGNRIETGAMPKINFLGNVIIARIASRVFGYKIKDALSGTKILPGHMFLSQRQSIAKFFQKDTYGDLSYFLMAKLERIPAEPLKVNYFARQYGSSGLNRLENGIELLRNLFLAYRIIRSAKDAN